MKRTKTGYLASRLPLVAMYSLAAGAMCGCSGHSSRIVGTWTTVDPGYDNVSLVLKPDGSFSLHGRGYIVKDSKAGPYDIDEDGTYTGGDATLGINVKNYSIGSPDATGALGTSRFSDRKDGALFLPVADGGTIEWRNENSFVVTAVGLGTHMEMHREP